MFFYAIVILLAALDVLFWLWADHRLRPLRPAPILRTLLAVLVGGQVIVLIWWVFFPWSLEGLGGWFWRPMSAWLYVWHLLALPFTLFIMLLAYGGIGIRRLILRKKSPAPVAPAPGAIPDAANPHPSSSPALSASPSPIHHSAFSIQHSPPPPSPSPKDKLATVRGPAIVYPTRRQFLGAAAAFAPQVALAGGLIESYLQIGQCRIRDLTINLPGLPKALDGMVIAHVSDTHCGRFVREKELEHVVAMTAGLKPDLIAFTGDLIDFNLADLPMSLAALKQLEKIAPMSVCVGNHDLFENGAEFRRRLRMADLPLMVDETMAVTIRGKRIELLGLDWGAPNAPRTAAIEPHMQQLIARRHSSDFSILLAHHPHAFDQAIEAGIPLTLSGHTHGGQIMLTPSIGFGRIYKYWSGLYENGPHKLVVSNGVGNWFPIRIGAPAEIVKVVLRVG